MTSRLLRSLFVFFTVAAMGAACTRAQNREVGDGGPGPVKAEHLTAELVTLSPQIAAGGTATLGLSLTLEENWHVYFVNPGDVGEAPSVKWTLPKGITAGPLQFPPPLRLPLGPFMDYGYKDEVTFPITLTAAKGIKPGKVHLDAQVTWVICSSQCFPGKAHLGMDLTVVPGPLPEPAQVGALGTFLKKLPAPLRADMSVTAVADAKQVLLTLHSGQREEEGEFFPYDTDIIASRADQVIDPTADGFRMYLQRAQSEPGKVAPLPAKLHGLLRMNDTESYEFTVPVTTGVVPAAQSVAPIKGGAPNETASVTVWSALGLAFLGGILLNLMPCVFPVLFLKGLALVNGTGQEKQHQRAHGLVYTLGILVTFWAIVGVLLALRAGGSQFGWGFQLQSPTFVAILDVFLFFFALSLAGQFEIGLSMMSAGDALTRKQGYAGSFFTGVLAVVVATPCTAPLMGAAIGFALAQSLVVAFAVFTALALGLAMPYLVLSWQPGWTAVLPKPGAWMEYLKQLTAVPLFATVIVLAWVYGSLYGANGMDRIAWLMASFLVLAVAGWALGRWPAKTGSTIAAVLLVGLALYLPLRSPKTDTVVWTPYTAESLESARASGNPVFVDFTAAWCLSCKVNEAAVLDTKEVKERFAAAHVVLLRADWTSRDDFITKELAKLDRSGVPTYVIYPAGKNSNPDVLPELLTKGIVLKQLDKDLKLGGK